LRADVNTIQIAMNGRHAMLRAIFGGSDEAEASAKPSKADVAKRVKLATRAHNKKLQMRAAAKAKSDATRRAAAAKPVVK